MADATTHAFSDALILEPEGTPTLSTEAAAVLARIIRAARDHSARAHPQAGVEAAANRRIIEGH